MFPAYGCLSYPTYQDSSRVPFLCKDVNLKDNHIVLRDNKNGRDHIVPISDSLAIVCEEYLKHSEQYRINYNSERFFIKPNGKPFGSEAAYKWFRKLIYEAGIS